MMANSINFGRRTVILSVLFCVAAMFVTSFVYRMNHPNLFVQVQQGGPAPQEQDHDHDGDGVQDHGPDGSETGMGAPVGMGDGTGGAMAKVREYLGQVKENPNDVKALINLGNSFLMMRAWDRALDPLEKANKLEPGNVGLLKAIGIAHFNSEDFEKATDAYKQILEIEPNDTLALFNLGVIHKYYFDKQDVARTYFEKVLAVEKEDAEIIKMANQEIAK
jgi:Tfp pilus assembly protein PilF